MFLETRGRKLEKNGFFFDVDTWTLFAQKQEAFQKYSILTRCRLKGSYDGYASKHNYVSSPVLMLKYTWMLLVQTSTLERLLAQNIIFLLDVDWKVNIITTLQNTIVSNLLS